MTDTTARPPLPRAPVPHTLEKTLAAQSAGFGADANDVAYDVRHPTYLGEWETSVPNKHWDIAQDDMDEPHMKRRLAITAKHPEVKELYGIDTNTKWVTLALVSTQVALAYAFGAGPWKDAHWGYMVAVAYVVGATITGVFGVLIHECSHNLAFKTPILNRFLGLIVNVGIVFPISASFRRYHLEHHTFQGVYGKDPDLPLAIEWKLIKGSKVLKLLWVFCFPFLYVLRGALMLKTPQTWEIINWIWTISSDLAVFSLCGPRGLAYLALSLWFGYGLHPAAAHFIQEHYTWNGGQETYSYYGSLNGPFMNIGYHNEHHDFTKVPWSKLPAIRAMAPEFYDTIAYHTSWVRVIYEFVMKDELGPQSRLGRHFEDHKNGRATIQAVRKSAKAE
ncbi:Sphingolipid delta(4)-desaturase DES1 [Allomyces javanicus]|nr:Sphingolipid delta(4)-desaturase DES1 [Allomyces javanicus]